MDFKRIKKLIQIVEDSKVSSVSVEEDNVKIEVKKEGSVVPQTVSVNAPAPVQTPVPQEAPVAAEKPSSDPSLVSIKSPMVGTFYSASNPESGPYVKIGDTVAAGDVVCIVEAMKLFNEIESDVSGTIEKILVENGTVIEYGQEMFLVRV